MLSVITKAACYEQERGVHLSKSKNPKRYQQVFEASLYLSDPKNNKASSNSSNGNSGIGDSSSEPPLKLTSIAESLTLQLLSLQNDTSDLKDKDFNRDRRVNRKCVICNKTNVNSRCTHCYLCGLKKHYARNCNKNQHYGQGN